MPAAPPAGPIVRALRAAHLHDAPRDGLLRLACEAIRALGPPYTSVYAYMLHGDELVLEAFSGRDTEHRRIPVGSGVCGTAGGTPRGHKRARGGRSGGHRAARRSRRPPRLPPAPVRPARAPPDPAVLRSARRGPVPGHPRDGGGVARARGRPRGAARPVGPRARDPAGVLLGRSPRRALRPRPP